MAMRCGILYMLFILLNKGVFKAKCDFVQTVLPASVIYGKDDIVIQCLQDNLRDQDSIYNFVLSKEINGKTDDIVKIEADTNNPPNFFRTVWFDKEFESRGSIEKSQLLPVSSAKLDLHIKASNVSCKDDGIFRCGISISGGRSGSTSSSFTITVLDSTIKVTDETLESKVIYDVDDIVKLKCTATFSTPSCIRWCIKREDDVGFKEYDITGNVINSDIKNDGCEYRRQSVLHYNISGADITTQFVCEISATRICSSDTKQDSIIIRNTNMDLITANVSEQVIYKKQSLKVKCLSKPLNLNDQIDRISLSKINSRSEKLLVEAKYHQGSKQTVTTWYDNDFEDRATVHSFVIIPSKSAVLNIEIPATSVECWDAVTYRCEMFLIGEKYSLQQKTVKLIATGKYIETIVPSQIRLGEGELDIICSTSFFDNEDTVSQIVLSKESKDKTNKLVSIELNISTNGFTTYTRWHDKNLKTRSEVLTAVVYPADQAKLHIRVTSAKVLCSDSGQYVCEVYASNAKHGRSIHNVNITVDGQDSFTVTEKTCIESNGQYQVGHIAMLHCGGYVGNPPMIPQWCRRKTKDSEMTPFLNDSKVSYTNMIQHDCQFLIYSVLEYVVTEEDDSTAFTCASSVDGCNRATSESYYKIQRVAALEEQASSDQVCYRDVIREKEIGCEKIGGYIGAVVFLSILSTILLIAVCYSCCRN